MVTKYTFSYDICSTFAELLGFNNVASAFVEYPKYLFMDMINNCIEKEVLYLNKTKTNFVFFKKKPEKYTIIFACHHLLKKEETKHSDNVLK